MVGVEVVMGRQSETERVVLGGGGACGGGEAH